MNKEVFHLQLAKVSNLAAASKFRRMLHNPFKYLSSILFRELVYRFKKQEKMVTCQSAFGSEMTLMLPAAADIYLTGGKTHPSEIRLAKFLVNSLDKGSTFCDVGAHFGYFTLLASKLVGNKGKVIAFEAAPRTYQVLETNTKTIENVDIHNKALSDASADINFYEFPTMYSEFNSMDVTQFETENWYASNKPKAVTISSVTLDSYLAAAKFNPELIKIDVEGAELKVLSGLKKYLTEARPIVVMEYLAPSLNNSVYAAAESYMCKLGYVPFIIDQLGQLKKVSTINHYFEENSNLRSENVVFVKG